jgi:hypothetical protein
MAALLTLADAKRHLRVDTEDENADILVKVDQASAIVIDYLKSQADATWTAATVPGHVQAATLIMLAHLYEHRGDDPMDTDEKVWLAVGRLLMRSRDPAMA